MLVHLDAGFCSLIKLRSPAGKVSLRLQQVRVRDYCLEYFRESQWPEIFIARNHRHALFRLMADPAINYATVATNIRQLQHQNLLMV